MMLINQGISEAPPRTKKRKSKHRVESSTPAPTPSGLPADFFDTGVKKKFYPKGEEPLYDLSSDEDEGMDVAETTPIVGATPTIDIDRVIPASSSLPSGIDLFTVFRKSMTILFLNKAC